VQNIKSIYYCIYYWSQYTFKKSKMVDGRHFEKPLNRHISATVQSTLINYGLMTHIGPLQPTDRDNYQFLKTANYNDVCHFEQEAQLSLTTTRRATSVETVQNVEHMFIKTAFDKSCYRQK